MTCLPLSCFNHHNEFLRPTWLAVLRLKEMQYFLQALPLKHLTCMLLAVYQSASTIQVSILLSVVYFGISLLFWMSRCAFMSTDAFKGYGKAKKAQNPMYMTSNSMYGLDAPTAHTMPAQFHGVNQRFSSHMAQAGMPRSTGLSTSKDASRVHDALKP